jgi:hypothetical protein
VAVYQNGMCFHTIGRSDVKRRFTVRLLLDFRKIQFKTELVRDFNYFPGQWRRIAAAHIQFEVEEAIVSLKIFKPYSFIFQKKYQAAIELIPIIRLHGTSEYFLQQKGFFPLFVIQIFQNEDGKQSQYDERDED